MTASAANRPPEPLVCTALGIEARTVRKGWPHANLVVLGMRAPRLEPVTGHHGPVVLLGFGGGLSAGQQPGDVVVATEIRDVNGCVKLASGAKTLSVLRRAGIPASGGALWCSEAIVRGSVRDGLSRSAVAVDMESARVATACAADRLAVVRVIVDTPSRGLVRASIFGGRRAKRALRDVAAALAAELPPTPIESITSGTVELAAHSTRAAHSTTEEG
jgi:hypothetical protein